MFRKSESVRLVSGVKGKIDKKRKTTVPDIQLISITDINNDDIIEVPHIRRERIRGPAVNLTQDVTIHKKSPQIESALRNALKANEFVSNVFKGDQLQSIIDAMYPVEVKPKEFLITQGDSADRMYVSIDGEYDIIINNKVFDTFRDKRVFGELALLYNKPRLASIKALKKGQVYALNSSVYRSIKVKSVLERELMIFSFLKNMPMVNKLPDEKLHKMVDLFTNNFYETDSVIIKQGDKGDVFYIVKSGKVGISVDGKDDVAILKSGDYFGERALIQNDVRQATVKAKPPGVELFCLLRNDFNEYLGDFEIFKAKTTVAIEEEKPVASEYDDIQFDDLKRIALVGVGGFGKVEVVSITTKTKQSKVLALKSLAKQNIMKHNYEKQVRNEKNIHRAMNSDFIIRLYKSFQDEKYIYFLLETCLGGDLWSLQRRQNGNKFPDKDVKFYGACVLEALSYIHGRNYVYLDLKPENILIDNKGYAKLSDFGNAMSFREAQNTRNFLGTPEYISPEIIYHRGYDVSVDFWAFGILLYDLSVGKTPFYTKDETKQAALILKGIELVHMPGYLPSEVKDLVKKFLNPDRTKRLGCKRDGFNEIRKHQWFGSFDWDRLIRRELTAPHVPKIENDTDLRNFEKIPYNKIDNNKECPMIDGF